MRQWAFQMKQQGFDADQLIDTVLLLAKRYPGYGYRRIHETLALTFHIHCPRSWVRVMLAELLPDRQRRLLQRRTIRWQ